MLIEDNEDQTTQQPFYSPVCVPPGRDGMEPDQGLPVFGTYNAAAESLAQTIVEAGSMAGLAHRCLDSEEEKPFAATGPDGWHYSVRVVEPIAVWNVRQVGQHIVLSYDGEDRDAVAEDLSCLLGRFIGTTPDDVRVVLPADQIDAAEAEMREAGHGLYIPKD